jgi:A/G-specific adenine glycosylase
VSDSAGVPDEMALPESADLEAVRQRLLAWYEREHRSYPWRETTDPYAILVCEVMSQQTQLDRVEPAWEAFLEQFPTVETLSRADRSAVLSFWSEHNLGYNNRARYLHEAAQQIVDEHGGDVPDSPETLETLMGVGPYTANAVASFAFNEGGAVVDTNVERVLYRAFGVPDEAAAFSSVAETLLPPGESRRWNNSIMELGGVACTKTPKCDESGCPWREYCEAYRTGDFTAPDVQTQPTFEGSRRQMRGRVVAALAEHDELALDALGPRIRVDYDPDGETGRTWLAELVDDLADDGLVTVEERDEETVVRLQE